MTHNNDQKAINNDLETNGLGLESEKECGRGLVWLGHKPSKLVIPGSNPGDRTKKGRE